MKNKIEQVKKEFAEKLSRVATPEKLEELRVSSIGKKGSVTLLLQALREVSPGEKREMGILVNQLKSFVEQKLSELSNEFQKREVERKIANAKKYDLTLPCSTGAGSLNPRTITQKQVEDVFVSMGFVVEDGNEVETEFNNFDAVNVPKNHPARDMQDTFWLDNGQVLKTHTSAAQNRIIKKYGVPCKAVFPGRCFRNEAQDAGHEHTFFQFEGVVVDENVSVAHLIFFIKEMLAKIFKKEVEIRIRPGYFPFVEPGLEIDAMCPFCGGKGCSTCKHGGWIELCPCGLIHPNVLEMAGVDSKKYSGFAFGFGFDRLTMISHGISDIRQITSGNVKWLKKFGLNG